jgi:hypothetical protein
MGCVRTEHIEHEARRRLAIIERSGEIVRFHRSSNLLFTGPDKTARQAPKASDPESVGSVRIHSLERHTEAPSLAASGSGNQLLQACFEDHQKCLC